MKIKIDKVISFLLINFIGWYTIANGIVWYYFYDDPIFSSLIGVIGLCIIVVSLINVNKKEVSDES